MFKKELGKITKAQFGLGGYQEVMIGLSLTFGGEAWGVSHFIGSWGKMQNSWHVNSGGVFLEVISKIQKILSDAKVSHISQLIGIPVEVTFEGNKFIDFRILTEVI